jgi:uncharacterized protein YhaN
MIITEIYIDGFGIFNGFSVTNLKKGINIMLGANEAGKSTLLKFLKFTLFGYPRPKVQRMAPLYGGNHGGRIKAVLSTDKQVIFERNAEDKLVLNYDSQISSNESQWLQLLGNATEDIYKNVFAFSLTELVDMESLSDSRVADKIFSIGAGLNISIGDVSNDIQERVDQIYSPRGSKQLIPAILKDIQEKKNQLKAIQENLPLYQELTEKIQHLEKEISEINNNLKRDRIEKGTKENYLKCYESFVSVVKTDEELILLPEPQDYPEDGPEELNKLEKEEKELKDRIVELQNGNNEEIGIYDIDKKLQSVSVNSEILKEKTKVNYLRSNLEKYKQAVIDKMDTVQKISSMNSSIHDQLHVINSDWTEENITGFSNILLHHDRIKEFKQKLEGIKQEKTELESQKRALIASSGRINSKNALIMISIVLLLASIPAFYYSLYVLAIICNVIALVIFLSRRFLIKVSPVDIISKQLDDLYKREKEIQHNLGNYLENELNLERGISVDSVAEIIKTVEQLKKYIIERDRLDLQQKETKDPFIHDFENEVKRISNLLNDKKDESDIEILAGQILDESDTAALLSNEQAGLTDLLSRKKRELVRDQEKLDENRQSINGLLKLINAANKDDFRAKHAINTKVRDLTEKRKNAINTIETIVGIDRAIDLIEFLKTHDQAGLREEISNLDDKISLLSKELDSKNTELGAKKGELGKIEGESELAGKMTELEIGRQRLADAYKEWITGKIALEILSDVSKKYEKEKQPVIIQNSSKYFNRITAGRYNRINVALDKREITVFDTREASRNIDQLSRGTKEQLLISLRLGFIEEYETRSEPLPIIVDEVLVNFDPDRAKNSAEIFQEFGKDRQIIFFTCHPYMVEYFNKPVNLIDLTKLVEKR